MYGCDCVACENYIQLRKRSSYKLFINHECCVAAECDFWKLFKFFSPMNKELQAIVAYSDSYLVYVSQYDTETLKLHELLVQSIWGLFILFYFSNCKI